MDILFATTELSPYVKASPLADASAALPKALRGLGHDVAVVLPRWAAFEESGLLLARRLTPLKVEIGEKQMDVTIFDGRLPSQVDIILLDAPALGARAEVLQKTGDGTAEGALAAAVFSKAVAELARQRALQGRVVDVVHANGWGTALIPMYLRELAEQSPELARTRAVFTIHDGGHQGVFPRAALEAEGVVLLGQTRGDRVNATKAGIAAADLVATVSEAYARGLTEKASPEGLSDALLARTTPLLGIPYGIDSSLWNPATDAALEARYDAEDFSSKARCRGAFQRELGLPVESGPALVGYVGNLSVEHGGDLFAAALPKLLRATEAHFFVAVYGEEQAIAQMESVVGRSVPRAVFLKNPSEGQVRRMLSALDFLVIPSRHEPCGLWQLRAQRYGVAPIAHGVGGIVDSVVDADAKLETGTGFLFVEPSTEALLGATERAVAARLLDRWPVFVRRLMRLDRAWDRPARRYEQAYRSLVAPTS
jgi:starch synthase